jgi:uncharacterized protein (TIGR03437 family)
LIGHFSAPNDQAQTNPTFQLQPFLSGLSSPILIRHAGDGTNRLFIIEQTGIIKVLQPGSTTPTNFLNVTTRIVSGGERGLLGLAFHPQFETNRRFFINYTRAGDGATVIAEYLASSSNPNVAETAEKIILTIPQPFVNHNGGMIEFGPDGFLYIGMGDGGSANDPGSRAQNVEELLGKMLRIDINTSNGAVPYSSPSTNPFFGAVAGRDEIYALGLRNPWRWSFDRATGELYAGDVGQGQREEIDLITRGGNYGWRVYEGTNCTSLNQNLCNPSSFIAPITEYGHTGSRCSVTGGYVYRGTRSTLPVGTYIYADYCTGEIFLYRNGSSSMVLDTTRNISSFGEDEAGELYVVGLGGTVEGVTNPAVRVTTNVSAASYRGDRLAPGSIGVAFGSGLSTATQGATLPLPTNLAGTQVRIIDVAGTERLAPLFFVSPTQVNYQIPDNTPVGRVEIRVTSSDGILSTGTVEIAMTAPGIFTANSNGSGVAAANILRVHQNGAQLVEPVAMLAAGTNQFVSREIDLSPTDEDVFLVLFGTGIRGRSSLTGVSVTIGGQPMQVTFAGEQGSFIGLDQVNVRLSRSLIGRGVVDVVLTVDGVTANTVTVQFK